LLEVCLIPVSGRPLSGAHGCWSECSLAKGSPCLAAFLWTRLHDEYLVARVSVVLQRSLLAEAAPLKSVLLLEELPSC